jgi:hypothetical protein
MLTLVGVASWATGCEDDCEGWKQTGECRANGPREPWNDKGCAALIPSEHSGWCECSYGVVNADCGHGAATCDEACEAGRFPEGSGSAYECLFDTDCGFDGRCDSITGKCQ